MNGSAAAYLVLAGIVLAASGCGGSGGGGSAGPAPVTKWTGTRQLGTIISDDATGVAVDNNGNLYVVGETSGDLDGNNNADPTESTSDLFVAKFSGDGVKQ